MTNRAPIWSARRSWTALTVLMAATCFGILDRITFGLMAPPMAASLHLSNSQLGMVKGLGSMLFSMVAIYPLAWLSDRVIGRRLTLLFCITIWAGGTIACGFAQSYMQFFGAAVAVAAAESGLGPISISVVPDLFPAEKRATANAFYITGLALAASLCSLIVAAAAAWAEYLHTALPLLRGLEPWRLMFLLAGVPAPFILLMVAATRFERGRTRASRRVRRVSGPGIGPYLKEDGPAAVLILGALLLCGIASDAGVTWVFLAMARLFGSTPTENGVGLGISSAVGAVASFAVMRLSFGRAQHRFGHRAPFRVIFAAMIVMIVPAVLMVFVTAPWQAFALLALHGTMLPMFSALSNYILQDLAPSTLRGQLTALNAMVSKPFSGLGITLVGFLADILPAGPRTILIASALVGVVGLIVSCVILLLAEPAYLRLRQKFACDEAERAVELTHDAAIQPL